MTGHSIRRSFTNKLMLLVLAAVIIPLGLISVVFYSINAKNSYDKLTDAVRLSGRQIVSQMENRFSEIERVADTIQYYMYSLPADHSSTNASVLDSYSSLRTNLSSLKTTFNFSHICIFLENDKVYSNEGLMFYHLDQLDQFQIPLQPLERNGDETIWLYVKDQKYPFMVDKTYQTFSEILCIRKQWNSSRSTLNYVYFVSIDITELREILKDAYHENEGISGIFCTPEGMTIASSDESLCPVGEKLEDNLYKAVLNGENIFRDRDYLYFLFRMSDDWVFITKAANSYILANQLSYVSMFLLAVLLTAAIVIFLMIYMTRNMTWRLRQMSDSVRRVRFDQNQFQAEPIEYLKEITPENYDEIDQLAHTYNEMIRLINENVDHITELKSQEASLKYRLLQSLINPHFLYNILDSIATCNRIGKPELANEMIMDLTRFYRMTLRKSNELITIHDELEIATLYMELESICRGRNFDWEILTEDGIEEFLICKFTLQPFLENSIRHGMKGLNRHLHIKIEITYKEDNIQIIIQDNGTGIPPEKLFELQKSIAAGEVDTGKHFGICNVNARIASDLFGHGQVKIESDKNGTTASIEFQQLLPDE